MNPSTPLSSSPTLIGWKEVIHLPEWGLHSIVAKADTGARSSALDVVRIKEIENDRVAFSMVLSRKRPMLTYDLEAKIFRRKKVKSSNGKVQERFTILQHVEIGALTKEIEFSLVNRKKMICRVLLGRDALRPEFLVHPDAKYLISRRRRPRISQIVHKKRK